MDGPLEPDGRSATCTSKPPETSQKVVFQSIERRTVRPSPADGPQFISKSHSETVCFWNPICLCTADGPRYSTGRSAVHFFDKYAEPNLFCNPSRISPADGPGLKGGRSAVTVALRSNNLISFSVLMHLHVSSCIIHIKLYMAQNNVK